MFGTWEFAKASVGFLSAVLRWDRDDLVFAVALRGFSAVLRAIRAWRVSTIVCYSYGAALRFDGNRDAEVEIRVTCVQFGLKKAVPSYHLVHESSFSHIKAM